MLQQDIVQWLAISSMVFFNILCILGIVAGLYLIKAIQTMENKFSQAAEAVKESARNMAETSLNVLDAIEPVVKMIGFRRNKSRVQGFLKGFFG